MKPTRRLVILILSMASIGGAADTTFVQTWGTGTNAGWFSRAIPTNPGTGGVDGVGDGFLLIQREAGPSEGPLGAHARDDIEVQAFLGDYIAAGVYSVTVWFKNTGNTPLEMHVGLSSGQFGSGARYLSMTGVIVPVGGEWTEAVFDLSPDGFVWIGSKNPPNETFEQLLTHVTGLLFRHDTAPYEPAPGDYIGAVGFDNVGLNGTCAPKPGDFDCDADVDLLDFAEMLVCRTGPGGVLTPGCEVFDFDADLDVDWHDAGGIQRAFTGD